MNDAVTERSDWVPVQLRLTTTPFDAGYVPADSTRLTTHFANLAEDPQMRSERFAETLRCRIHDQ